MPIGRGTGERKPAWGAVPGPVKDRLERLVGARVERATRAYGGYAPSATFRIVLGDGRRVFFKGVYPPPHAGIVWSLDQEERIYAGCEPYMRPWAPEYLGGFRVGDWHAIVLEDLGRETMPPWTPEKATACARSYAEFHRGTYEKALPEWLSRSEHHPFAGFWSRLIESGDLRRTASVAGPRSEEAAAWLQHAAPVLARAAKRLLRVKAPFAFLHFDTRSDNIRLHGELLRIFDWNFASVGPPEFDAAAFAQSITGEGGPEPEQFVADYQAVLPLRPVALGASLAGIAGYFADRAWREPIAGMPRLRSVQRRQLTATLAWAARHFDLPDPRWLSAIAE